MSVLQVRALKCDFEGCGMTLADSSYVDAISVRMDGARQGWSYRPPVKGPIGPKGGGRKVTDLSADFCPDHADWSV